MKKRLDMVQHPFILIAFLSFVTSHSISLHSCPSQSLQIHPIKTIEKPIYAAKKGYFEPA